ncbi:hypothetical protein BVC93_16890 [Mycobacterium sp. MS1601]|uniref:hypothetical protein n=1 Tax=Mycobacterium sp. MS1601 TaxID=1936029 RepID=UPI0009796379|nr:hypothetical protein [Mycobacterium sp. MS1601]AQA03828.1 hypothetical protein BVC93_16890 [Mycobacterium sp. MS1601]
MAALWHIDNIGLLVWVAACGTVVFSARHVLRMWNVWILGLVLAPVMPFMLMTAQLGGSDTAITVVSAVVGTIAVFLASRFVSLRLRLLATLGNLVLSLAAVFLLADTGLYLTVIVAAGAVPLIVVLTLHRINWLRRDPDSVATASTLPTCKPQSYGVLAVLAIAMLCIQLPITRPAPVDVVAADWVHKSGLEPIESFDFITRFLGPDASLVRYRVPNTPESHESVVDIVTTSDLARLQDFSNAVWYPSTVPVNYAPVDDGAESPAGARSAHSDADSARDENSAHWNAVTWVWHSGEVYQQVTVLTSQTAGVTPPAPRELTVDNTLIEPFLWVTRQQPTGAAAVESAVGDATAAVVKSLQSEAGSDPAGTTTHAE